MIRVLHVLDTLETGSGVCAVVMNYFEHIDRKQVMFDFLVHEKVDAQRRKQLEEKGAIIYEMPTLSGKNIPAYKRQLEKFFNEHKEYDIVHGHLPNAAAFYMKAAKKAGVTYRIIHSHNSQAADGKLKRIRNRILFQLGIRYANRYFACSDLAADFLYGKDGKKVELINNAVDTKRFAFNSTVREKIRRELKLEDKLIIGHVGRFCEQKNQSFIIDIIKDLSDRGIQVHALLFGEGEQKESVVKKAELYGIKENVTFMGIQKNVNEYMNAMDVFVLPSQYEGLPVVGIEAQCNGLLCLFSNQITKQVQILDNVKYLPIDNEKSWENAIVTFDRRRNTRAVEKIINAGFSIEREAERLLQLYYDLSNENDD